MELQQYGAHLERKRLHEVFYVVVEMPRASSRLPHAKVLIERTNKVFGQLSEVAAEDGVVDGDERRFLGAGSLRHSDVRRRDELAQHRAIRAHVARTAA